MQRDHAKKGVKKAMQNGKKWGGSKPGWRWKVSNEQVESVIRMHAENVPMVKIAKTVGLSRPTIYKILKNAKTNKHQT